ncbi:hypothetical protein GCM10009585_12570 [Brevibacterium paucivorans]
MALSLTEYPWGHRSATSSCTGNSTALANQATAPARYRFTTSFVNYHTFVWEAYRVLQTTTTPPAWPEEHSR